MNEHDRLPQPSSGVILSTAGNKKQPSYQVGYSRPPRETQFQKGQSGNPRGRPRGAQNIATVLNRVLREEVVIHVKGRRKTITKLEFALQQLANKAISGDLPALKQLTTLARSAEEQLPQEGPEPGLGEADQKVLGRILQRAREAVKLEDGNHGD